MDIATGLGLVAGAVVLCEADLDDVEAAVLG